MVNETYAIKMIEMMQEELDQLKKILLAESKKKPVRFWGIWKGIDISDKEVEDAKRSLFKGIDHMVKE